MDCDVSLSAVGNGRNFSPKFAHNACEAIYCLATRDIEYHSQLAHDFLLLAPSISGSPQLPGCLHLP